MDSAQTIIRYITDLQTNQKIYMEYRKDTSQKFYQIETQVNNKKKCFEVYTHWGRIGNKGRVQLSCSNIMWTIVRNRAWDIIRAKLSKGYVIKTVEKTTTNTQTEPVKTNHPQKKEVPKEYQRFIAIME